MRSTSRAIVGADDLNVMRRILLVVPFLFASAVRADTTTSSSLAYSYQSVAEGKVFDLEVSYDRVLKTPKWDANTDSPPLAVGRAIKLATEQFRRLIARPEKWTRGQIILEECVDNLHWIYLVDFGPAGPLAGAYIKFEIAVLMDGTVVEPIIHEEK